jgi:hypothetical protein
MQIETRISGIPCLVELTHYARGRSYLYGPPGDCYDEPEEIEFKVLDRRGRPAPWLERKMSFKDQGRIEDELLSAAKGQEDPYY